MSMGVTPYAELTLLNVALTSSNVGRVKMDQGNCGDALLLLEEALLAPDFGGCAMSTSEIVARESENSSSKISHQIT
eukprot:2940023-Ditylum_brightwellii.AAC.1